MCGILFCYDKESGISFSKFQQSLNLQNHRGPDDDNIYYLKDLETNNFETKKGNSYVFPEVLLGHKRLSILDLSRKSQQPVVENNFFMMYNGEFYNYKLYSHKNSKNSDTLTLFNNLVSSGHRFLKNVNGMWSIVFGDWSTKKMFLSRDRFGKKPLYYYKDKRYFIVSSEIRSIYNLLNISRKVNKSKLAFYLIGRLSPFPNSEETFYSDILSVKPGQILEFDFRTDKLEEVYKLNFNELDQGIDHKTLNNEAKLIKNINNDLNDAIKIRLQSDAKVAIQVSGGVDSSIITSVVKKIKDSEDRVSYFTCDIINNENTKTSDTFYSNELAKRLKIKLQRLKINQLSEREFFNYANQIHHSTELPTNLFLASTPTYILAKEMHKKGIKVSLDGVGGDEIMGGYPTFESLIIANLRKGKVFKALSLYKNWEKYSNSRNTTFLKVFKRTLFNKNSPLNHLNINIFQKVIKDPEIQRNLQFYDDYFYTREKYEHLKDRQLFEIRNYQIPYYLGISDSLNMKWSIENRSPFLDTRLFKYIFIDRNYKIQKGFNKFILRKAYEKIVPKNIIWRKDKQGMRSIFSKKLLKSKKIKEMILDSNFIKSICLKEKIEKDLKSDRHCVKQLFSLAVLDNIYKIKI